MVYVSKTRTYLLRIISTVLKNEKTGQFVQCGGNVSSSMAGGAIGYHIQKGNDAECIAQYSSQGFNVINTVTK